MEKVLNIALSGLKFNDHKQSVITNNLANISSTGFRQQLVNARSIPVTDQNGLASQYLVATSSPTPDFTSGPLVTTGRPLDMAIIGDGWFVVQGDDGNELLTRNGKIRMDAQGRLFASDRPLVDPDGQPIEIPPGAEVAIGPDGTISILGAGDEATASQEIGIVKLVNPDKQTLVRRDDGFFQQKGDEAGLKLEQDEQVRLRSGAIEGSNVNGVEMLVDMVSNARHYEIHMRLVKMADQSMERSNQLLSMR